VKRIYLLCVVMIMALLAAYGCSPAKREPTASSTARPTPTQTIAATPTPLPTPIKTTVPDIALTAAPTEQPSAALTESAKPSADDGQSERKTVADGFYYIKLSDELKHRITGMSYPEDDENIKISYDDLRYIKLQHYDFEGNVREGELIVNKKLADEVTQIFYELYKAGYPLESVRLVDDFGEPGDDNLSMAANNTSAFNYRRVTGSKTLSRHSYGAAIDINPRLNPYIDGERIAPENGAEYADRSKDFAGKIDHDDLCYKLFIAHGWTWGGDWKGDKDYQHFSKDIGY